MREAFPQQMKLGQVAIKDIKLNPKSRDDIPQVLMGLQWLYTNEPVREEIFNLLVEKLQPKKSMDNGRPGMSYWEIFVMGILRLTLNWDYDALHEQANEHQKIRQMLGQTWAIPQEYSLQAIKDNVRLLTPEILDQINQITVKAGHNLVKKKEGEEQLKSRVDSFVVETNIHYPTDTNLLWDAMRKVIILIAELCLLCGLTDWRQHHFNLKQVKRHFRKTQIKKGRKKSDPTPQQEAQQKTKQEEAVKDYVQLCEHYLQRALITLGKLNDSELNPKAQDLIKEIEKYIKHAKRQIDQIDRRVLRNETIPHEEKVFSLFQPHTEWISKGKAGVSVELGVRVCIAEDQHQFILHHQVMYEQSDSEIAIPMVEKMKEKFPELYSCSFDKGFHSPANQKKLKELLPSVALPRKGKLSKSAKEIESSEAFQEAKQKHSAVESAINALEVHGLDRCPDSGTDGFDRYVSLAILARNIQRIGAILQQKNKKREQRKKRKLERQRSID